MIYNAALSNINGISFSDVIPENPKYQIPIGNLPKLFWNYFEKDYRRKSEREKPKFFSKKSKEFKDRDFNTGNKKKYKNKESYN